MTKLPEWFLNELPEVQSPAILFFDDGKYKIALPDGETAPDFDTVDEAYDYAEKEHDLEVIFDESLPERIDGTHTLIHGARDNKGTRMLMSHPDSKKVEAFEEEYEDFLNAAADYEKDPHNFEKAYVFVDTHPAFWNRPLEDHPWHWDIYGHCALHNGRLMLLPMFNGTGTPSWRIETGPHVEPEYKERSYDYRLDSHGQTVEEAFINLAALINKFYNLDGTDKVNVPHDKPQWVIDLEEAVEELDEED